MAGAQAAERSMIGVPVVTEQFWSLVFTSVTSLHRALILSSPHIDTCRAMPAQALFDLWSEMCLETRDFFRREDLCHHLRQGRDERIAWRINHGFPLLRLGRLYIDMQLEVNLAEAR